MIFDATKELESWLDNFLNFEKLPQKNIFWLDTMQFLCKRFHYPQDSFKSIHIAGSKGKGSVAAMIASIIKNSGCDCGLFTSPHLMNFAERITNAGSFFSEQIYQQSADELIRSIDALIPEQLPSGREITWFELVTIYSFLVFKNAGLDWAIFETGLGGRLDATNVISPELSILTPIELEHTQYLGNTIEKIAAEKAGIIKSKIPVWSAAQKNSVREVFNKNASEKHTKVFYVDDYIKQKKISYTPNGMDIEIEFHDFFSRPIKTHLQLRGDFQLENAALAILAIKNVLPDISESCIEEGLAKANLQARFEIIEKKGNLPKIILDGAHTYNSVKFTLDTLKAIGETKIDLLFSCAADKDIEKIAPLFYKSGIDIDTITITKPGLIKPCDFPKLASSFKNNSKFFKTKNIFYEEDCVKAITNASSQANKKSRTLLVTGSFYLAAQLKSTLSLE